jgi:hypothetical protein
MGTYLAIVREIVAIAREIVAWDAPNSSASSCWTWLRRR